MNSKRKLFFLDALLKNWLMTSIKILVISCSLINAQEPLDEMIDRRSRQTSAEWGHQYMEDANNSYTWQPESFAYVDQETGHEVWVLVRTPDGNDVYSAEHGSNAWSWNGARLGFFSKSRSSSQPGSGRRWIVNSNGGSLRAVEGIGNERWPKSIEDYAWSHSEDAYFSFEGSKLYKNFINQKNVVSSELLFDLNKGDYKEPIKDAVSTNDRWLVVRDFYKSGDWQTPNSISQQAIYVIDLQNNKLASSWGIARASGSYGGHNQSDEGAFHDAWNPGFSGDFIVGQYEARVFFSFKGSGTASDGGPKWSDWDGSNFGSNEIVPISDEQLSNPFGIPYLGHPVFDRWGRYALHGTYTDSPQPGTRITDLNSNSMLPNYVLFYNEYDGQHHSWGGWTDYVIGTGPADSPSRGGGSLWMNKFNQSYSQSEKIANTHFRGYDYGYQNYNDFPRPSQSPDGTKVAFSSMWLNNDFGNPYICYAVAYNPYPPVELNAVYNAGVQLSWKPPSYTTRGWPNEDTDPPPHAREIKRYNIWRSNNQNGDWQQVGNVGVNYNIDTKYGPVQTSESLNFSDNIDNGVYYYAITSEEHSGLESSELSEIIKVTVSNNNVVSEIVESQGQKQFWVTPPAGPSNFKYSSTGISGHNRLDWNEPGDTKIRYYNIYYSSSDVPSPAKKYRIASVPVGTSTYLDWCASSGAAYYTISSVDRYGNEGIVPQSGEGPQIPINIKIGKF